MDERRKGWLTSRAFARLCDTTKETLRHYKDMGLLNPAYQGDNGYFYYDAEQFYDFLAISLLRQTGTPLEQIRQCRREQNAAGTLELLREQQDRLRVERKRLEETEFIVSSAIRYLELGASPDLTPRVADFRREHLLAIPVEELEELVEPGEGEDRMLMTVLDRCRQLCGAYGLQSDYRLGAIHPTLGAPEISHLYIRVRGRSGCPYYREKPAGTYLYLCCRGRWDISEGYATLAEYAAREARVAGEMYACDLAGFILNQTEPNAASIISVRLK